MNTGPGSPSSPAPSPSSSPRRGADPWTRSTKKNYKKKKKAVCGGGMSPSGFEPLRPPPPPTWTLEDKSTKPSHQRRWGQRRQGEGQEGWPDQEIGRAYSKNRSRSTSLLQRSVSTIGGRSDLAHGLCKVPSDHRCTNCGESNKHTPGVIHV